MQAQHATTHALPCVLILLTTPVGMSVQRGPGGLRVAQNCKGGRARLTHLAGAGESQAALSARAQDIAGIVGLGILRQAAVEEKRVLLTSKKLGQWAVCMLAYSAGQSHSQFDCNALPNEGTLSRIQACMACPGLPAHRSLDSLGIGASNQVGSLPGARQGEAAKGFGVLGIDVGSAARRGALEQ